MPRVALVTLGCARNEVDSEELAGRLDADGWTVVDDPGDAEAVVVNTCGFVDAAKKDSIDILLAASDLKAAGHTRAVVAVGCLAERYGEHLATALPEADAVLGFDDYTAIGARLRSVLGGQRVPAHTPKDRRTLLPLTPLARPAARLAAVPGHGRSGLMDLPAGVAPASGPRIMRQRLEGGPTAPLKLASGCDRRCSFCAIPSFRGAFLSRPPGEVLDEARWLADRGVRELVLVSENSTSYGKDLGDLRLLEGLLPEVARIDGIERVRVSYLQPAEMRPTLIDVMCSTDGVIPYFDLSFQHASQRLLRSMRRFGDTDRFLDLLAQIRAHAPQAGVRSNVIVGFPGEEEADLAELETFLELAGLDAVGVFGYSDEEGTEAAGYDRKVDADEIARRVAHVSSLAHELIAQRAEQRIGESIEILVESLADGAVEGRSAHQAPEVDGTTAVVGGGSQFLSVGALVPARVIGCHGVDLVARVSGPPR